MESRVVHTLGELLAVRSQWASLMQRSAGNNVPTLTPEWLTAWWKVYGATGDRRICALLITDGDELIGIAPLLARRAWYLKTIPFRRLELFGTGEDETDESCSDYVGVIAAGGREQDVAGQLARALVQGALGRWDDLVLDLADGEAPMTHACADALRAAGLRVEMRNNPIRDAPYIALPDSWEGYLKQLSSSRRAYMRKSIRSFERWAAGDQVLHIAATPAELTAGRDILYGLHAARWAAREDDGSFASPLFRSFHDHVLPELFELGALELMWLSVRGEPVGILYNIVWNNRVYFYQSGRVVDVPKGVRPGIALHALAIQRAIAAGRVEYDFLAGYSAYAQRMSTHRRPIMSVRATRVLSPVEAARRGLERAAWRSRTFRHRVRAVRDARTHDKPEP